jgi:hypothetical protein
LSHTSSNLPSIQNVLNIWWIDIFL